MEMAFALSEFEFKIFTLAIDFQFRIVTYFWKSIFEFEFSLLMATLGQRTRGPPFAGMQ